LSASGSFRRSGKKQTNFSEYLAILSENLVIFSENLVIFSENLATFETNIWQIVCLSGTGSFVKAPERVYTFQ